MNINKNTKIGNTYVAKCDYPDCQNEIRLEDEKLKDKTAKLCEDHNDELNRLVDAKDKRGALAFMLKVTFQ